MNHIRGKTGVFMKESALRDLIAQKISQLKPGLTLLQKEQYIPGKHGTKSFIDLYARDEKGRHVLIEFCLLYTSRCV